MKLSHILSFLLFLTLFAGGYFYVNHKNLQPNTLQTFDLSSMNTLSGIPKNCEGKKYCITVFVAPWCPYCKQTEPVFKMLNSYLLSSRPDVGFGIVVGQGTAEQNLAGSELLKPIETTLDNSGLIFKERSVVAFPNWIVYNSEGQIVINKTGSLVLIESQMPALVTQFLGIPAI